MKKNNLLKVVSCAVFASLYLLVAVISLICSTEFFALAHGGIMSWVLAVGFEVGAMSCLLSTLVLPKNKQGLVWVMFVILTLFQCMSNTYMAYAHLDSFQGWIELFGLQELETIAQKRILSSISGAILPLVALGFIRIMANTIQSGREAERQTDLQTDYNNTDVVEDVRENWNEPETELDSQDDEPIEMTCVVVQDNETENDCKIPPHAEQNNEHLQNEEPGGGNECDEVENEEQEEPLNKVVDDLDGGLEYDETSNEEEPLGEEETDANPSDFSIRKIDGVTEIRPVQDNELKTRVIERTTAQKPDVPRVWDVQNNRYIN